MAGPSGQLHGGRCRRAVFRLLGAKDLGTTDDYHVAKMPPVNHGLLDGQLAWRQHDGGHTDGPNWKYFIAWADKFLNRVPADRAMPRTDQNSLTAHAQLLEKAKTGRIDVYFMGDSITRRWGATDYPECWLTGERTFSDGTQPILDGAATPLKTSSGVSIMENWTESIRRSLSCLPAPTTSRMPWLPRATIRQRISSEVCWRS